MTPGARVAARRRWARLAVTGAHIMDKSDPLHITATRAAVAHRFDVQRHMKIYHANQISGWDTESTHAEQHARRRMMDTEAELVAMIERALPTALAPVASVLTPELRRTAAHFATYLAPAVDDDNNYYRGECDLDGKDAADIGELCADVVTLCDALMPSLPTTDEAERIADANRRADRLPFTGEQIAWILSEASPTDGLTEEVVRFVLLSAGVWSKEHGDGH